MQPTLLQNQTRKLAKKFIFSQRVKKYQKISNNVDELVIIKRFNKITSAALYCSESHKDDFALTKDPNLSFQRRCDDLKVKSGQNPEV